MGPESLQDILGALLVLLVRRHVNAFMMKLPPNYWATPGTIFPLALIGAGAFGMGLISNWANAAGPLMSSAGARHRMTWRVIIMAVRL